MTAASDLGTLGGTNSTAFAVNASGQAVGYSSLAAGDDGTTVQHAFFVDVTGPMVGLNTLIPADSGWELNFATGINDGGQISGYGRINGQTHAFLLSVPEPTTLAGLAVLAGGLLRRHRR